MEAKIPQRTRTIALVILAAIVVAALLAVTAFGGGNDTEPSPTAGTTVSEAAADPQSTPTDTPIPAPTPTATPTPTPTATATPTTTPIATPTPTPTPQPLTLVVFLQGLNSALVDGRPEHPRFDAIKSVIAEELPDSIFLPYSYTGVKLLPQPDGSGYPLPADYDCSDTHQNREESVSALQTQLDAYTAYYQDPAYDVRIALVGHSLGGLVAVLGMSHPEVERVVTLDSPLMGVGSGKALAQSFWDLVPWPGCGVTSDVVLGQLSAMQADAIWPAQMERRVSELQARGGRIATLGNEDDCYYDPKLCLILCVPVPIISCPWNVDETFTQVIKNADSATLCHLGYTDGLGHTAILHNSNTARYIASFISPHQSLEGMAVC